jgi:hypothetical protein
MPASLTRRQTAIFCRHQLTILKLLNECHPATPGKKVRLTLAAPHVVAMAVNAHDPDDNGARISISQISRRTGVHRKSVARVLRGLDDAAITSENAEGFAIRPSHIKKLETSTEWQGIVAAVIAMGEEMRSA